MQPSPAVVYVVDDDQAVRDSLRWLIESVGLGARTFASAHEFLEYCAGDARGCLLLDVRMPGMSGLELQERLASQDISLPVIIITGHADVTMAVRAMKAGAVDFVEKPFSDQVLLDKVQRAIELDAQRHARRAEVEQVRRRMKLLSPREETVMRKVVEGKSNRAIAAELGLSQKTVEVHRAHVMAKVKAPSLAHLVRMAMVAEGA